MAISNLTDAVLRGNPARPPDSECAVRRLQAAPASPPELDLDDPAGAGAMARRRMTRLA
jgi:hypothetical protein